ncbi:unnamed protein product, partial [Ixodes hexagonus]
TPEDQPTSPESPIVPRTAPASRPKKLPLLPRGEIKVVFRPRNGLNLAIWQAYHVTESIALALDMNKNAARTAITAQIQGEKNIAVVSTAREDIAYKLLTVQSLTLGGKTYPTHTYVAAPDGSTKAVVHGVKPNTPKRS